MIAFGEAAGLIVSMITRTRMGPLLGATGGAVLLLFPLHLIRGKRDTAGKV